MSTAAKYGMVPVTIAAKYGMVAVPAARKPKKKRSAGHKPHGHTAHTAGSSGSAQQHGEPGASYNTTQYYNQHINSPPKSVQKSRSEGDDTSDTDSAVSDSSIEIIPTVRSEADGYNAMLTPSGRLMETETGQKVELWAGVHIPESMWGALAC
jgi:hypothetical protein